MRVFLMSCLAAALIATTAAVALYFFQEPVQVAFTTESVRL
jgi:hypothetical protein